MEWREKGETKNEGIGSWEGVIREMRREQRGRGRPQKVDENKRDKGEERERKGSKGRIGETR